MFMHEDALCGATLAMMLGGIMLAGMAHVSAARAEVVSSPARALQMLTEARVAAEKCNWLDAAARRELTDYAARAELAAVKREGPEVVKRAVRQGKARGSAGCTAERRELVTAVLRGAREAARRELPRSRRIARPAMAARSGGMHRAERRVLATARAQRQQPRARANVRVSIERPAADVRRYQRLAATYYAALKCRNRPHAELQRMWREVREMHFAILRSGRKPALARAKAAARRAGTSRRCT